jgi:LITAF-like zinc ribbon domain
MLAFSRTTQPRPCPITNLHKLRWIYIYIYPRVLSRLSEINRGVTMSPQTKMGLATGDKTTPPPYSHVRTDPIIESAPEPANGTTSLDKKHKLQPKYKTSIPINQLSRYAVPTDCPACGQRNITKLTYKIGGFTQLASPLSFLPSRSFLISPYRQ